MPKIATTPSRRLGKIATIAVIPLSLIFAGALVSTASYSAFSATTSNPSNNWSMGSVGLSNSSPNSAAFDASNLKPGSTGTTCISVTSTGGSTPEARTFQITYTVSPDAPSSIMGAAATFHFTREAQNQ